MADRIELHEGSAPWRPSPDAELLATYRYYDCPLVGVVAQHGNEYLFACLDGETEILSLWLYATLRADQRAQLEHTPAEEFTQTLHHLALDGCAMLAFATEGLGIVDSEPVEDDPDPAVVGERMRAALHNLRQRLSELSEDASHLEVTVGI